MAAAALILVGLSTLPASRLIAAAGAALVIIGIAVATAAIPNMTTSRESVIGAHKCHNRASRGRDLPALQGGTASQATRSLVAKITE